jgi:hypothetical protein
MTLHLQDELCSPALSRQSLSGSPIEVCAGSVPLLARPGARISFLRRWRGEQAVAHKQGYVNFQLAIRLAHLLAVS